jgi:hypothetical protein
MKKIILVIAALTCLTTSMDAQKKVKEKKYKEIFYKDILNEYDDMTVSTNNGISNKELTKFKLKFVNKTNDILLYKPEESTFKLTDKEVKPKEKWVIINPNESDFRIVNVLGPDFLIPYSYVLGGVYKVSTNGNAIDTPDFMLPPSQNEFTTGGFTCSMTSLTKESDKTEVKFECRYTGDKIGVINPNRAAIKLPDGTEMANEKSKSQPIMVMKGKTEKITLKWNRMEGGRATDMQKIKMQILWRNTFTESDAVKVKDETLEFQIDEALSK